MLITYDSIAQAMYLEFQPDAQIAQTIKVTPETFVDLDTQGKLIGIEFLHLPC